MILGLTGGIASGKTTASDYFDQQNCTIVDADIIARQIVAPNSKVLERLIETFGADIVDSKGDLLRVKLRELAFKNQENIDKLNNITHPAIRQEILIQLNNSNSDITILSAALLFENGLQQLCDNTLLIDCDPNLQLERAIKRDKSNLETIKSIIKQQMPRAQKQALADVCLLNDKTLEEFQLQLANFYSQICQQDC